MNNPALQEEEAAAGGAAGGQQQDVQDLLASMLRYVYLNRLVCRAIYICVCVCVFRRVGSLCGEEVVWE
jgi:hypothetical protein